LLLLLLSGVAGVDKSEVVVKWFSSIADELLIEMLKAKRLTASKIIGLKLTFASTLWGSVMASCNVIK